MSRNWLNPLRRTLARRAPAAKRPVPRLRNNLELLERRDVPAAFTPGDIVVYREGDTSVALGTAGNPVFIDEYTTAGAFVQSIPLNSTGTSKVVVAQGTATSEGFMQLSG